MQEAVFPKGGAAVNDTVLFGKYQIRSVIGRGRSGTVFLARHLGLKEDRAIKRVAKEGRTYLAEAAVLKSLRCPGIPVIYDLEEDSEYYYLIEEYLDGESLHAFIERRGSLKRARVISWGIELCRIMSYLHSCKPNPILYLDLQPGNILICGGTLKLIDFDQAVSAACAGRTLKRYGTVGCAAPEQYTGELLDERTDIYAIGSLLYYMGLGRLPGRGADSLTAREEATLGRGLAAVIVKCLRRQKEARYQSAEEVAGALRQLEAGVFTENEIPLLTIAVCGSSRGIGATHAALSVAGFLSGQGLSCLYREENESGAVRKIAAQRRLSMDDHGVYHTREGAMMPRFGGNVRVKVPYSHAVVTDFGTGLQPVLEEEPDLIFLVCGMKSWEREDTLSAIRTLARKKGLCILMNHLTPGMQPVLPGDVTGAGLRYFRLPPLSWPECGEQTEHFWRELFLQTGLENRIALREQGGQKKRRRIRWEFR